MHRQHFGIVKKEFWCAYTRYGIKNKIKKL